MLLFHGRTGAAQSFEQSSRKVSLTVARSTRREEQILVSRVVAQRQRLEVVGANDVPLEQLPLSGLLLEGSIFHGVVVGP